METRLNGSVDDQRHLTKIGKRDVMSNPYVNKDKSREKQKGKGAVLPPAEVKNYDQHRTFKLRKLCEGDHKAEVIRIHLLQECTYSHPPTSCPMLTLHEDTLIAFIIYNICLVHIVFSLPGSQ